MSEQVILENIQDSLQAMAEFADADVVIADWSMLDGPIVNAPYIRIMPADSFEWRQDTAEVVIDWTVPVVLYVKFSEWDTSYVDMRNTRQAVLDNFAGDNSNLGETTDYCILQRISAAGPVGFVDDNYNESGQVGEATPLFLFQILAFEVEERIC